MDNAAPSNLSITTDKSNYAKNSTVKFTLSAENGYYKHIGIHKIVNSNNQLYYEQDVAGSSCSEQITDVGYYCANFDAFNAAGTTRSDFVYFTVGDSYTVKFNGNGSTSGSMSNQTFTYDVAQNLTANTFQCKYTVTYNYNGATGGNFASSATATATFNGWATSASGSKMYDDKQSVKNLATSGTVNLYANWTLKTVTLPTPTRTGYTFGGWNTKSDGTGTNYAAGASFKPTAATTLYAQWTINQYTVQFVNADGTVLQTGKWDYNATPIYSGTTPTKAATAQHTYTFNGWTPTIAKVTKNVTYTATYTSTVNQYTVTFRP